MKRFQIIAILLIILLLAWLPMVIEKDSTITLLILILLYVALASSWNILGGYTGSTSLGHAAFFGLGALATRLLWIDGFPILPSVFAGGFLAVAFALLIGAPAFRLKGVYFAIGTLALAEILNVTVGNVFPQISSLPVEELVAPHLDARRAAGCACRSRSLFAKRGAAVDPEPQFRRRIGGPGAVDGATELARRGRRALVSALL